MSRFKKNNRGCCGCRFCAIGCYVGETLKETSNTIFYADITFPSLIYIVGGNNPLFPFSPIIRRITGLDNLNGTYAFNLVRTEFDDCLFTSSPQLLSLTGIEARVVNSPTFYCSSPPPSGALSSPQLDRILVQALSFPSIIDFRTLVPYAVIFTIFYTTASLPVSNIQFTSNLNPNDLKPACAGGDLYLSFIGPDQVGTCSPPSAMANPDNGTVMGEFYYG